MRAERIAVSFAALLAACDSPLFTVYDGGASPDAEPLLDAGCAPYATRKIALDPERTGETRLLIAAEPGVLLASVGSPAALYRYTESAGFARTGAALPVGFIPRAGVISPQGPVLLSGSGGRLVVGASTEATFRVLATSTSGDDLTFASGTFSRSSTAVYVLGTSADHGGHLFRFDGQRFLTLWGPGPSPPPGLGYGHAAVVALSAREAYAISRGGACLGAPRCVLHAEDDVVREESTGDETATALAVLPSGEVVVGTARGGLLERGGDGAWRALGAVRTPSFVTEVSETSMVRAILPLDQGVAFFTDVWFGRVLPGQGTCEPTVISLFSTLEHVYSAAKVGDQFVVVGAPVGASVAAVVEPDHR